MFGGTQRAHRRWTTTLRCLRPQTARSTHPDLRLAFARRGKKGGLPPQLREVQRLLMRGLKKTEQVWPALEKAYALVHQAAHVLANHEEAGGHAVRTRHHAARLP